MGCGAWLKQVGLSGQCSDQIAFQWTAAEAFWTLFWSPGHRATMLEPQWKSMGSGAALALEEFDPYERYLVTYHLSDQAP